MQNKRLHTKNFCKSKKRPAALVTCSAMLGGVYESITVKINSMENDIQTIKKILAQMQHSRSISSPLIIDNMDTVIEAIGQPLEQNQSEFCPHWTPPVLIKQESEEI